MLRTSLVILVVTVAALCVYFGTRQEQSEPRTANQHEVNSGRTDAAEQTRQADPPPRKRNDSPSLAEVFRDDFSHDTRADYKIAGDVSWQPGGLTLAKDSSVERVIDGGSWAKVTLVLEPVRPDLEQGDEESRIWFLLDGAENCCVRLRQKWEDGQRAVSIGLVETAENREVVVPDADSATVRVEYRQGLVRFDVAGGGSVLGYIPNGPAAVSAIRVRNTGRESRIVLLAVDTFKLERNRHTEAETQQLATAKEQHAEVVRLVRQGELARAAELGERVVSIRQMLLGERHPSYAASLNNLAFVYDEMGDYARAKTLYVEALRTQESLLSAHHPQYARNLNNLAGLYQSVGEYPKAARTYQQVCQIFESVLGGKHPDYATSLNNLGGVYDSMGNYADAERLYQLALDIRDEVLGQQHPDYASSLNNLAGLYEAKADYRRAEPLLKRALDIHVNVFGEQHVTSAICLGNLASLYNSMGLLARAEPLYKQSLRIKKSLLGEQHPSCARTLNNLAGLYERVGEYAKAEILYKKVRGILKTGLGEQHPVYAASLCNQAALYRSLGDDAQAEQLYKRAARVFESLDEPPPHYIVCLVGLGGLYVDAGDYPAAEPLFKRAALTAKSIFGERHPDYASSLNSLATLYYSMGDSVRAVPLLEEVVAIVKSTAGDRHPHFATCLINLAVVYESLGDFDKAEALFKQALDIVTSVFGSQHPDYASGQYSLASLYEIKGDYAQARPRAAAALRAQLATGTRTIPALSGAQSRAWTARNAHYTYRALSCLRESSKRESSEAYSVVWETKLLASRLRVGRELLPDASPKAVRVFARLRDARLKLARVVSAAPERDQEDSYQKRLAVLSRQKEELEKELAALNPASMRELAIRDATIAELIERLPEKVAVVDFVSVEDPYCVNTQVELTGEDGRKEKRTVKRELATRVYDAFVVRRDGRQSTTWVELGSAEPIEQAISDWRQELTAVPVRARDSGAANTLRGLVWDKLEPHLRGVNAVVIVPDGALHRLPWAALPGRKPNRYLVHDYALSTASSGQQLFAVLADPPVETQSNLLVVGGIRYDQRPVSQDQSVPHTVRGRTLDSVANKWAFLQGAGQEVRTVADLWADRGAVSTLEETRASESTVAQLLPQYRFVHLATHGFFDVKGEVYAVNLRSQSPFEAARLGTRLQSSVAYRNPLLMTGIVMAGANVPPQKDELGLPIGDDGILTAEEISGLDLRNTELVTLSACETGLGDVAAGQGVYGLTRVLHQSGVRSALTSLWKVDDSATRELMKQFYTNLWVKKLSKVEALRRAQIHMIENPVLPDGTRLTRGDEAKIPRTREDATPRASGGADPRYWAAFQLSGDWR